MGAFWVSSLMSSGLPMHDTRGSIWNGICRLEAVFGIGIVTSGLFLGDENPNKPLLSLFCNYLISVIWFFTIAKQDSYLGRSASGSLSLQAKLIR